MRTASRRPPTALAAIALLMATLGLSLLLIQALSDKSDPATVQAEEAGPAAD